MSDKPKKGFTFDNSDEMYEEVLRLQHLVATKDAEIERLKKERDQAIEWMGPTDCALLPESEYPELYAHLKEKENAN